MELWIRSQDKEDLIKAYNFRILNQSDIAINVEFNGSSLEYLVIGRYSTKERALEVLDEIQNIIKIKFALQCDKESAFNGIPEKDINYLLHQSAVFDMPQE